MRYMTSNEIRKMWIKYFEEHGHKYVKSAHLSQSTMIHFFD